jgi:GNAT superfamily N-acetyltransferase
VTSTIDAAIVARAMTNYLTFWSLAARSAGGTVEEDDGLVMISTGLPIPFFNPAALLAWPDDPLAVVERVRDFAARHGCPSAISTWDEVAERFEPVARQLGLQDDGATPVMVMTRDMRREIAPVEGLSISVVMTPEERRVYAETVAAGNELPLEWAEPFAGEELLATPGLTAYLGSIDGRPVATSLLLETAGVAGVHVVCTVPEYRRRGIGAALTLRCAEDGLAHGCDVSALQSSSLGYPVYERIGYRKVTDIRGWTFA